LGFEQYQAQKGISKRGTSKESKSKPGETVSFPTPWNHLETGIMFGLGLPLLVFRERGIAGGVFDHGVTDVFVHDMPNPPMQPSTATALSEVFLKWQARVREFYYK
jgi:hypothetical protein